jgi:general secretion pathway protein G
MAQGFTLVEILIVVVILGILAAIVIPQFTSASETAKASSLQSQLQTIRSQLELYQVQHNGEYPTQAQLWGNLTGTTDIDGNAGADYGPYLQKAPENPFEDSSTVDLEANAATGVGWVYDEDTGAIKAVMDAQKALDTNMDTTNDVVTY